MNPIAIRELIQSQCGADVTVDVLSGQYLDFVFRGPRSEVERCAEWVRFHLGREVLVRETAPGVFRGEIL